MNFFYLLDEFEKGRDIYPCEDQVLNKAGFEFFLRHGHQIADDDLAYDEFMKAFPNFFDYDLYEKEFLEHYFGETINENCDPL